MNVQLIKQALEAFIKRHKTAFENLVQRETALLEIGALVLASEHYRLGGYSIGIENDKGGFFSVKLSSRGYPYNFSWFSCSDPLRNAQFEIHSNLAVRGAHRDEAVYVVDVAVVRANAVPRAKTKKRWIALSNQQLITFAEVKKLVVYPMLLAQFVGIVHEIKPKQLNGRVRGFARYGHFSPALISLGYLQGTSGKIVDGFLRRKYRLCVIHSFDSHLSSMRTGSLAVSPFLSSGRVI